MNEPDWKQRALSAEKERDEAYASLAETTRIANADMDARKAAEAKLREVERETIERCARVCDDYADRCRGLDIANGSSHLNPPGLHASRETGARKCAAAIRSLPSRKGE